MVSAGKWLTRLGGPGRMGPGLPGCTGGPVHEPWYDGNIMMNVCCQRFFLPGVIKSNICYRLENQKDGLFVCLSSKLCLITREYCN